MLISVFRGNIAGALDTILSEPPYGEGVDEAKVRSLISSSLSFVSQPISDNMLLLLVLKR